MVVTQSSDSYRAESTAISLCDERQSFSSAYEKEFERQWLQQQRLKWLKLELELRLEEELRLEPPPPVHVVVLLDAIEQARIQGVSVGVLLCFSLSESIGMNRGALLPLDSVTRIQSSKFWMMECDAFADLLIICRWANPRTPSRYCETCSEVTKTITTSCKHDLCLLCAVKKLNSSGSCIHVKCEKKVTAMYFDDLFIICRRANQTTTSRYCANCLEDTKTIITSCEHNLCLLCAVKEWNRSGWCVQCRKKVTAMYFDDMAEGRKRARPVEDGEVTCSKRTCPENIPDTKALTIEDLKRKTEVSDAELDTEITELNFYDLAGYFDEVDKFLPKFGLTPSQKTDVANKPDTRGAMTEALKLWHQPNPYAAKFRALIKISLDLRRGDIAVKVCQYIANSRSHAQ